MKDKIFIDSNIFLYAFNDDDIEKQKVATKTIMNENSSYYISLQVINEVSNNMLKKLKFTNTVPITEYPDTHVVSVRTV